MLEKTAMPMPVTRELPKPPPGEIIRGASGGSTGQEFYKKQTQRILNRLKEKQADPRSTLESLGEKQPKVFLKADHTPEQLAALHNKDLVGPKQYGEGLVNKFHKDGMTPTEHENAQLQAYDALKEKVARGVVDPSALGAEINQELGVTQELTTAPTTMESVMPQVGTELKSFVEKGYLTPEEAQNVQDEISQFTPLYKKCYPDASPARVYLLARDNARKLAYQIKTDKNVFSGSDHGDYHIIKGNLFFARKIIASMRTKGVPVSEKTELLVLQMNYDHDARYAEGAAQIGGGFEAMKDHPLFGAYAVEANQPYYEEYYGKDEYDALFYSVLHHSYPKGDFRGTPDDRTGINKEQLRSLTAAVDCLGVTAENKSDSFFRKPEAIKTLLQMRLAMEVAGTPNKKGIKVLEGELMQNYRDKLTAIANQEPSDVRKQSIKNAIDGFFNEVTVDRTLALYAAVVEDVGIMISDDGSPKIDVVMQLSRVQALLGGMFGPVETEAAIKAMRDQGLTPEQVQTFGVQVEQSRRNGTTLNPLVTEGANARFTVRGTVREENAKDPYAGISEVIENAGALSIRTEVNSILNEVDTFDRQLATTTETTAKEAIKMQRNARIIELKNSFIEGFTNKTSAQEISQIDLLTSAISTGQALTLPADVARGIADKIIRPDIKGRIVSANQTEQTQSTQVTLTQDDLKAALRYYVTQSERDFMFS